jgi:hypothetical protein
MSTIHLEPGDLPVAQSSVAARPFYLSITCQGLLLSLTSVASSSARRHSLPASHITFRTSHITFQLLRSKVTKKIIQSLHTTHTGHQSVLLNLGHKIYNQTGHRSKGTVKLLHLGHKIYNQIGHRSKGTVKL